MDSPVTEIVQVVQIEPHTKKLDVLICARADGATVQLVTGPHYRTTQLGLWIPPGRKVPGYLAADLWLPSTDWFTVEERTLNVRLSQGLFCGSDWQNSRASEWQHWKYWRDSWRIGDDPASWLGIV